MSAARDLATTFGATNQATTRARPVTARTTSATARDQHAIAEQVTTPTNVSCSTATAGDTITRSSAAVPTPHGRAINCLWLPADI